MHEKHIEEQIKQYINSLPLLEGNFVFKSWGSGYSQTGTPDLIGAIVHNGVPIPFMVDVKREGGFKHPKQVFLMSIAAKAGYTTGFVYSLEDFKRLIHDAYQKRIST